MTVEHNSAYTKIYNASLNKKRIINSHLAHTDLIGVHWNMSHLVGVSLNKCIQSANRIRTPHSPCVALHRKRVTSGPSDAILNVQWKGGLINNMLSVFGRVGEGRACWSLGNAYVSLGNHRQALHYARRHLDISREVKPDSDVQQLLLLRSCVTQTFALLALRSGTETES